MSLSWTPLQGSIKPHLICVWTEVGQEKSRGHGKFSTGLKAMSHFTSQRLLLIYLWLDMSDLSVLERHVTSHLMSTGDGTNNTTWLIFIFSLKMNIYAPVSHMVLLHFYNCIMKSLMLCIFVLDDVYRMISHASALFSSLQTSFIHYCNEKHCFCQSNMWLH